MRIATLLVLLALVAGMSGRRMIGGVAAFLDGIEGPQQAAPTQV